MDHLRIQDGSIFSPGYFQIHISFPSDTRFIPFAVACLVFGFQLLHSVILGSKSYYGITDYTSKPTTNGGDRELSSHDADFLLKIRRHVSGCGGYQIFGFMVARLMGCSALLLLSGITLRACQVDLRSEWKGCLTSCPEIYMVATYSYASILAVVSLVSHQWNVSTTRCNIVVLLSTFGTYAYRDLWPLARYDRQPEDLADGSLLWGKVVILLFTAAVIPLAIPRRYIPIDPKNSSVTSSPEQTASLISFMSYAFMDDIILKSRKVPHLGPDDMYPLAEYDEAKYLAEKGFQHLDFLRGAKHRHMFWNLMRVLRKDYALVVVSILTNAVTSFAAPIGINGILYYLETDGINAKIRPWFWILWLFLGPLMASFSFEWYIFLVTRALVRTEALLTELIFEHSLRIRLKANVSDGNPPNGKAAPGPEKLASKDFMGKLNNHVTTDLANIIGAKDFLIIFLHVPISLALSVIFLYKVLGWSAFAGLFVMVILTPLPGYVSTRIQSVQKAKMKTTDARVQAVTEAVNVIRMIKLFGWERKMEKRIEERRQEELKMLWKLKLLELCNVVLSYFIPTSSMIITYGVYTAIMKETLTYMFTDCIAVFAIVNLQFSRTTRQLSSIVQGKVSLERLGAFLQNTELLDAFSSERVDLELMPSLDGSSEHNIGFKDAAFTWSKDDALDPPSGIVSNRRFKLYINGELLFRRGHINLIIGPTGSGKTSMLMALLGEMRFVPPDIGSWFNLPRDGGVAYVAQESWVQNDTIRNNILFGSAFEEERYRKVIKQCALERDLELFEAGDVTEVGERGLTLSGGQKARLTLARAVYSRANILLLDDILAALDVHTSAFIVEQCLRGDLIRGRTVLLITHKITLTRPSAGFIVSLGLDGTVHAQGTEIPDLQLRALTIVMETNSKPGESGITEEGDEIAAAVKPAQGRLILAEEVAHGHITKRSLNLYIGGVGRHPVPLLTAIFGGFLLFEASLNFQTWFLGYWGSQYEGRTLPEVKISLYLAGYTSIVLGSIAAYCTTYLFFTIASIRAAKSINTLLLESIFGSTLRWLDETPTGRIIGRCTQDIRTVDGPLPPIFENFLAHLFGMVTKSTEIVLFTPIFSIPGFGIGVLGVYIGNLYLKAQLSAKREMSNARSPILAHFSAAMHGLISIRAYGAQEAFIAESLRRINHYSQMSRTSWNLNRWISVRMDALGALFSSSLALYLVYGRQVGSSNTGFSLNMAVQFSSSVLWTVRMFNLIEVQANSLERIQGYIDIEHEPNPTESGRPPAAWPTSGELRVENLSARYSPSGPKVLHDISFNIKSGERIGTVGRTGSGKSSLTLALLRCILTEGRVIYDGISTNQINLDALRSSITIIPQTPELLSGSLRQNLDPFEQNDDATLHEALRAAGLFTLQDENDEGHINLDTNISGGGANLSVGQRQILALARAMIRRSKLVILDEATSAIDYKTDAVIKDTLRYQIGSDVTVITIAHRLQTILDADRIMVLDSGRIVEFDTPNALLVKKDGAFKALASETGVKAGL